MLVNFFSLGVTLALFGYLFPSQNQVSTLVALGSAVVFAETAKAGLVSLMTAHAAIHPTTSGTWMLALIAFASWVLQILTGNYSWVDRLWSITPVFYVANYFIAAWFGGYGFSLRLFVMTVLVTIWGCRLTYNFYRKGGYNLKDEDYRWEFCRSVLPNPIHWHLFGFFFIAGYQHVLLFLITMPAKTAYDAFVSGSAFSGFRFFDMIALLLFVGFLTLETITDEQQWEFQSAKWAMIKKHGKSVSELSYPYNLGFCTTGMFTYSRHANFFGEFMQWWALYLFAVSASGDWVVGESLLGTILLTLLFQGSTPLTEYITVQKYPLYTEYQKRVSMLIPWKDSGGLRSLAGLTKTQ